MNTSSCNIKTDDQGGTKNSNHPCYSEKAHHHFARMHLAVAPGCNIQCNYCNRKYNCANESRPGVVVDRLTPDEALAKVAFVADEMPELSVIGIAGPGDTLASPQRSFETLEKIKENFPDLKLCLSTNGLALPKYVKEIARMGVEHVTVTVNSFNPETMKKIYDWVKYKGKKDNSTEAMINFMVQQRQGIAALVNLGVMVKINSLLMPGINDHELPDLAKKLKDMGVFMHNIMPLIAKPEHGTRFGLEGRPEPTTEELNDMRASCGDIKQMAHCQQCRADAVGKLGEDRFAEFTKDRFLAEKPNLDNGSKKRAMWRKRVAYELNQEVPNEEEQGILIACMSESQGLVNQHFGHAKDYYLYEVKNGEAYLLGLKTLPATYCKGDISCGDKKGLMNKILGAMEGVQAIVCLRVGAPVAKEILAAGILPVTDQPMMPLDQAAVEAANRVIATLGERELNLVQEEQS